MPRALHFAVVAGLVAAGFTVTGCMKKTDDGAETVTGTGGSHGGAGGAGGSAGGSGAGGTAGGMGQGGESGIDRPMIDRDAAAGSTADAGGSDGGAPPAPAKTAIFPLDPGGGNTALGEAKLEASGGQVTLTVVLAGAAPGLHAVDIHQNGSCGADASGFPGSAAGEHWNPTMAVHGRQGAGPHHLGDVGNVMVGDDGAGNLTVSSAEWTLGTGAANDVAGRALVVHALPDDFTTQPDGAAGFMISCGVITRP
jgi:superoxide dismutase, Cu-Zn family